MHDRCGVFSIRFLKMSELISVDRGKGPHLLWGFVNHKSPRNFLTVWNVSPLSPVEYRFLVIAFLVASECKS